MISLSNYLSLESVSSCDFSSLVSKISPTAKKVTIAAVAILGLCLLKKAFEGMSFSSKNFEGAKSSISSEPNDEILKNMRIRGEYFKEFQKNNRSSFSNNYDIVGQTLDRKYVTRLEAKNFGAPTLDWLNN